MLLFAFRKIAEGVASAGADGYYHIQDADGKGSGSPKRPHQTSKEWKN